MEGDYLDRYTGILALAGIGLWGMMVATIFWPWLVVADAALAGALAVPMWRWYREMLRQ